MRASLPLLFVGLASGSCVVEEDVAMFIEGALPATAPACVVKSTDTVFLSQGVLDLGLKSGYAASLKVRTNLPATFNNQDVTQDQGRSPNYPDYGAVDNNVVTFESADISFSFKADANTILGLKTRIAEGANNPDSPLAGVNLTCDVDTCTTSTVITVPAAGTVFNTQTQLNTATVVNLELLPSDLVRKFDALYAAVRDIDGDNLDVRTYLDTPAELQRLNLEIVLRGRTTGNQNFRKVTSAPYPFDINICVGCLAPTPEICAGFNALAVTFEDVEACLPSQDDATGACVCADTDGDFLPDDLEDDTGSRPVPLVGQDDENGIPTQPFPVLDDRTVCTPRGN